MDVSAAFASFAARLASWMTLDSPLADDAFFNEQALALHRLQFERVPLYRRWCEQRGTRPDRLEHWSRIPALPTASFKDFEITSLPPAERAFVFHSSGTTAQRPSRHFHDAGSRAIYEASLLPWFQAHLLAGEEASRKLDFLILTPPPTQAPHSSLAHMFDTIRRRWGSAPSDYAARTDAAGDWVLETGPALAALEQAVADARPLILLGTAFSYVHLLDHLTAGNQAFRLPAGSRALETGGYKGRSRSLPKADLHRALSKRLGLPPQAIISEYGMSELSSQAYDAAFGQQAPRAGGRLFRFPPWARAQVISPETGAAAPPGEPGLIRVFDLANIRSVLAVQTEDLGQGSGDGLELLGRAAQSEPRGCSRMAP